MRAELIVTSAFAALLGCGAASTGAGTTPSSTARPSIELVVEERPPRAIDGSPVSRLRVVVIDPDGVTESASADLEETGVEASSCAATEREPIVDPDDPDIVSSPHREFACTGIHTGYWVALFDTEGEVTIYTRLSDEDPGRWQLAGGVPVPNGVHLVWRRDPRIVRLPDDATE
jgi:hypothetical protein